MRRHIPRSAFVELQDDGAVTTATLVAPFQAATLIAPANAAPAGSPPPAAASKYSILGRLGQGAMGEVHVARDEELLRKVALKRMAPAVAASPALAARFLVEAQVTAQLDHPHIVPIYGIDGGEGAVGYSMKLVQGRTFGQLLDEARRSGASGEAERLPARLEIFLKVCDAIEYAHSKRVVHRDLKPENIMVGRYNEVYVMDWGICRVLGQGDGGEGIARPAGAGDGTQFGAIMGTPAYMSPEQASGAGDLDGRSDVYTLGLILQEVCTLGPARTGDSLEVVLDQARRARREPMVHAMGVGIARELKAIIRKATAADPARRYPSAAALAADVRRHLRGEAVEARPDGPIVRVARALARHRLVTLAALSGTVLVGALAVMAVLLHRERGIAAAHAREERTAALLAEVAERAHGIDDHFYRFEALLAELAGHAEEAVTRGATGQPQVYFAQDYQDPARRPADARHAEHYGRVLSFGHPAVQLAPGVEADASTAEVRALASLGAPLRTTVLASGPAGADPRKGLPIHRAYVSLVSGVHVTFPGDGAFPAGYDARRQPRYLLAAGRPGMHWGDPAVDRASPHLLLPMSASLWSAEGQPLGVAGIEITFDWVGRTLLPLDVAEATYLVDEDGRMVVSWTRGGQLAEIAASPLPFPEVIERIRARQNGRVALAGGKVAIVMPLTSLGWSYVAIADDGVSSGP